ncbi:MAG: hypothetical protein AVDCRST_MAG56-5053, partial [uncultured Cytophagales bacterium]
CGTNGPITSGRPKDLSPEPCIIPRLSLTIIPPRMPPKRFLLI